MAKVKHRSRKTVDPARSRAGRRKGSGRPWAGGRDAFTLNDWTVRILATLAAAPRTRKDLGLLQGAYWWPAYGQAVAQLQARCCIVLLPAVGSQRHDHFEITAFGLLELIERVCRMVMEEIEP